MALLCCALDRCIEHRNILFPASVALSLFSTTALSADLENDFTWLGEPAAATERWNGWGSLGGAWNSDTESFGEFVIFAPFSQDEDTLFFGEARGRYFEDDLLAGNAAIGFRQMTESGFNLGAWIGVDVFNSVSDNTFGQVSGGVEALSTYFDFRANGYLPFTDPQKAAEGTAEVILTGPDASRRGEIYMIGAKEVAAYGGDAEAGFRLPFGNNVGHIGAYGGGYWYDADDLKEAVTGGLARVELAFNDVIGAGSRLTAVYRYTDDNVNGGNHMVGGRLRIPLGKAPALSSQSQQWQRMIDPLERNPNIYIGPSGREQVEDGYTEVRFDRVTYADTDTELSADIAEGANTLLVLDGTTPNTTNALQAKQTLAGGGSMLKVKGIDSGTSAYAHIPGTQPTIEYMPGQGVSGYALTLGGYNTVNGIDVVSEIPDTGTIDSVTLGGIDGSNDLDVIAIVDTNVTVSAEGTGAGTGDVGITGTNLYGINLNGVDTAWLVDTDVKVTMTGNGGVGAAAGGLNVSLSTQIGSNNQTLVEQFNEGGGAGNGGDGVAGQSAVYGIALNEAENVWLNNTTIEAWMTGTGGAGGSVNSSNTSETVQIGNNNSVPTTQTDGQGEAAGGGDGGDGVSDQSAVYGIALNGAENVWLKSTTVEAWMIGTGGAGGNVTASNSSKVTQTGNNNSVEKMQSIDGGNGGLGGDGVADQSALYGIALNAAENVWLESTRVDAGMTGTGGAGGNVAVSNNSEITQTGDDNSAPLDQTIGNGVGGDGGEGVAGQSAVYGISLNQAENVWLANTMIEVWMTGAGGNGGSVSVSDGSTLNQTGENNAAPVSQVFVGDVHGGNGGDGIDESFLYGLSADNATLLSLTDTTVTATMTGTGGDGASGGYGNKGIDAGSLVGISLQNALDARLTNTSLTAAMIGTGGNGSDGNENSTGYGNKGIDAGEFVGIDLTNSTDARLSGTTVTATIAGTGGDGGGNNGDESGYGGMGVDAGSYFGIDLNNASGAQLSDTEVAATLSGTGGDGGEDNGMDGGYGGSGINNSLFAAILLESAIGPSFLDTRVTATVTGTGGRGGDNATNDGGDGGDGIFEGSYGGIILENSSNASFSNTLIDLSINGFGGNGGDSTGGNGGMGGIGFDAINFVAIDDTNATGASFTPPTVENVSTQDVPGTNGSP